ncbi:MAG: tRNA threonylcarbamoyladenosine dehydratase [Clostridia bacterium]|nr:tRNA threonylcarbamoyladenosine dehydratase [Clostridia bacterium]
MDERFARTEMLLGKYAVQKLNKSRIAVFGAGGVGGYCIEALARSGVGAIDIIDGDRVDITNLNRQILATENTVGKLKADAAEERIKLINRECKIKKFPLFFLPDNSREIDFSVYDYVVDAVDTVSAKIEIILRAKEADVKVISAMGAGNKLDATRFKVADIYKTDVCPLARVMRRELKKRGVKSLKVVYSDEPPTNSDLTENAKPIPASVAFVPSVAGLIIAGEVIKDLI